MNELKVKSIRDIESLDIINPNWVCLDKIENRLKSRVITEESNLSVRVEVDKDSDITDYNNNIISFDPIKSKKREVYIKHNSILIYSGLNRASFSYEIMLDFALNELMLKQGIKKISVKNVYIKNKYSKKSYVFGYVYLNRDAIKFIVNFFNSRTKISSFLNKSENQKAAKIRSEIKRLIDCGFINEVYCVKDGDIYKIDKLYSLNIFDCYPGFQVDKTSYVVIKNEKDIFDSKYPNLDYSDYIKEYDDVICNNNEKININNLGDVDIYLITIIKTYNKELSFALENKCMNGIKLNISNLAREMGCTRKVFENRIKGLVFNQDLIETRKGCYILNPERYCV